MPTVVVHQALNLREVARRYVWRNVSKKVWKTSTETDHFVHATHNVTIVLQVTGEKSVNFNTI